MLRRAFTEEQRDYCVRYLQEHSLGHRGSFDGAYISQFFGLLGQVVVSDLVGYSRPSGPGGFDGGVDLTINGVTVDVKTVIRSSDAKMNWKVNLTGTQALYQTDVLLFLNYNRTEGVFTFLGWLSKKDFLARALLNRVGDKITRDDGSVLEVVGMPFYDLTIRNLQPIKEKEDLWNIH